MAITPHLAACPALNILDRLVWWDAPQPATTPLPGAIAGLTKSASTLGVSMSEQIPTIGRIVHYTLSEDDAKRINKRREDAVKHLPEHRENANGVQVHTGNQANEGDVFPMIIVRTWGTTPESSVNGQVFIDGNDTFWATSVSVGEGARHFAWPTRS